MTTWNKKRKQSRVKVGERERTLTASKCLVPITLRLGRIQTVSSVDIDAWCAAQILPIKSEVPAPPDAGTSVVDGS